MVNSKRCEQQLLAYLEVINYADGLFLISVFNGNEIQNVKVYKN